jgi:hypothetical protein
MHFVPRGWVVPDGPQQTMFAGQSLGDTHSIAPASGQSASTAHDTAGITAPR